MERAIGGTSGEGCSALCGGFTLTLTLMLTLILTVTLIGRWHRHVSAAVRRVQAFLRGLGHYAQRGVLQCLTRWRLGQAGSLQGRFRSRHKVRAASFFRAWHQEALASTGRQTERRRVFRLSWTMLRLWRGWNEARGVQVKVVRYAAVRCVRRTARGGLAAWRRHVRSWAASRISIERGALRFGWAVMAHAMQVWRGYEERCEARWEEAQVTPKHYCISRIMSE